MITSLKLYSHFSHTAAQGSRAATLGSPSLSLLVSHILHSPLLKLCCSLSVPIYRQEWCHQLQLFFNNGGCQLHLFFNNGGCQSQWLVSSICCTLMATNPTLCHLSKVQYNANKILRDMGISKLIFFL